MTLFEYEEIANLLHTHDDGDNPHFIDGGEWHYIQYPKEKNINLLKNLKSQNLLPDEVNICDCGIGLATTMYDFYLQSKEITGHKFTFSGIEKWRPYIDYLNSNLIQYWNDELVVIESDIMDINYSDYNFIYFFQPFKIARKAMPFYRHVLATARPGTLIFGIDQFNVSMYGGDYVGLEELFYNCERVKCGEWTLLRK